MRTLIGVVTGTNLDKNEERIAWIWPLVDVTGSGWDAVRDPEQEFPVRGSIFWPRASGATKDALFRFRAKENVVRKDGGDEFMVIDAQPAFEVLDLRSIGNSEHVRRALNAGISIAGHPSSRLLVWCGDSVVVGPVSLATGTGGLTTTDKNNRARIPCFHFKEGDIRQISFEGVTRSIVARASLGLPQGYVDWDDDRLVMRRAIEYAVANSVRGSAEFPRHLIDEAAEQLTKNGSSADLRLDLYRLERFRSLASDTQQLASVAQEVIAIVRKHPAVVAEIEQLKASERETAKRDAADALATERAELARLQKDRGDAEAALRDAKKSLDETETAVQEKIRDMEGKVQSRIADILSDAPALLANVSLLKPFLAGRRTSKASFETPVVPWTRAALRISNSKDLRARIIPSLKAMGVPPTAYQPIHAAFAGGLLPVVAGTRALEALQSYAHVVTGGRFIVIQATSALADVQDVFGRVAERRFVPHPAGLIDIVRAARLNEGLFLVVLDGINRGATESYLLPLIRAALGRAAAIALFHPSAVELSDPYRADARVDWPKNVLLAATAIEGPTSLPIAPDVWSDGVLIQTDLEDGLGTNTGLDSDPSEIDLSSGLLNSQPSFESVEWLQELIPSVRHVVARFEGGLRKFFNEPVALQQNITKCILVPFLASIDNEAERASQTKAVEKIFGKSLDPWIMAARRRVS